MSKAYLSGYGAARAKEGKNVLALDRARGYSATMAGFHDGTRSRYRASSKHYQWEKCGDYSSNDNLRGYGS